MHDATTLKAVLQKVPPLSRKSVLVTRFVFEVYRLSAASPVGALVNGGRYNSPGTQALYTSFGRATALAEFTQNFGDDQPIAVASMLNISIFQLQRLVDLTDPHLTAALGTSVDELTQLRLPRKPIATQYLGDIAENLGVDGLIVWSAQAADQKNLVVFPQNCPAPTAPYLIVTKAARVV